VRDFQRGKLYAWERGLSVWDSGGPNATPGPLSISECQRLAARASLRYRSSIPRVTDGRGARSARGSSSKISLPRWARTAPVVLHEAAHAIDNFRGVNDEHGPIFVRLFIQLLATYLGQDEAALVRSARAAGLKVAARQPVRDIL
jgi:hypothetical protein